MAHGSVSGGARFQDPSVPLRVRSSESLGAESLEQAPNAHPTLPRTPAPVPTSLFLPPPPQGPKGAVKGPRKGRTWHGQDSGCSPRACSGAALCAPSASRPPLGLHGNSGSRSRFATEAVSRLPYMGSHPDPR